MRTEIEKSDETTVRLRVVVDPEEFEPEIEKAAQELAGRVRLKGFRKGKVPRPVLEAHLGRGAIMEAAVNSSLERYLQAAAEAEDLDVVSTPKVENVDVSTGGLAFEATLTVMPKIEPPDWEGLEIEIPSLEVTDEEIDKEIDAFRESVAPLEPVGRPSKEGDFVLIDIKGQVHGETLPGLSLTDFSYQIGSGTIVPKLDKELEGKRPGDILKFNDIVRIRSSSSSGREAKAPSETEKEATFTVIVKEVRERRPAPLDDGWVEDNTEFDTVEELRADVRNKLAIAKKLAARHAARHAAVEMLADRVDVPIPEAAIESEMADIARQVAARLEAAGVTFDDYLRSIGKSKGELEYEWRKQATITLKSDLALDAIARAEGIEASPEEIEQRAALIARGAGEDSERLKAELTKGRTARSLAAGIIRSKALDTVLAKAVLTQAGGTPVGWDDLEVPASQAPSDEEDDATSEETEKEPQNSES